MKRPRLLSLCIPVYFEEDVISHFIDKVTVELERLECPYEIVFVDDGSKDQTVQIIKRYISENDRIRLVEFSYNHGKQAAVTAAITYAKGDYLLYMDPDLQDPPEEIERFLLEMEKGYDLVFGVRKEKVDSFFNRMYSKIFWGTLSTYTGLSLPKGLAVMRMFNRDFANRFIEYKEQNRFIEGIFMHIAMEYSTIEIAQHKRFAGKTKFNFSKKMKLAFDAIFDFSELPLKMAVRFGSILSFLGFLMAIVIFVLKLTIVNFQAGWPSIISAIILGTGLQIFFIGIAAIYIGRIYKESKGRPLFSVKRFNNVEQ